MEATLEDHRLCKSAHARALEIVAMDMTETGTSVAMTMARIDVGKTRTDVDRLVDALAHGRVSVGTTDVVETDMKIEDTLFAVMTIGDRCAEKRWNAAIDVLHLMDMMTVPHVDTLNQCKC
ncbi:hypothetical protein PHPALM_31754 [Phytophthora palmivora]|uniref:Uncharacterized protein n=1 Tax=Phytophthora palmivora TaxID=4796 RepID=A0A2P4X1T2_9STRA|nr:hypothetical protein PHPALM_31754 [Phytophthora palmivora]